MATFMPMAAQRQPFAPLNASRLQNLTSQKNCQNALSVTSPSKRKASNYDSDNDNENIDPVIFLSPKRSKATFGNDSTSSYIKPTTILLTKSTSLQSLPSCSPLKTLNTTRPMLQPRSPAPKIHTSGNSGFEKTLSAPSGRSPTRKRVGILNRRRTSAGIPSSFTRVDPPKFPVAHGSDGAAPFSIAAALSGTIPSYGAQATVNAEPAAIISPKAKQDSWFFAIHEDTEEETMQIIMEHSTCTLDISSDEETARRMLDERGKENVPPVDDVSQSQSRLPREARGTRGRRPKVVDEGAIEVDRSPLGSLDAEEFYAEGCCAKDLIVIQETEDNGAVASDAVEDQSENMIAQVYPEPSIDALQENSQPPQENMETCAPFQFTIKADVKGKGRSWEEVDALAMDMMRSIEGQVPTQAALFQPLEKAEEGFELWESGSAKGDEDIC